MLAPTKHNARSQTDKTKQRKRFLIQDIDIHFHSCDVAFQAIAIADVLTTLQGPATKICCASLLKLPEEDLGHLKIDTCSCELWKHLFFLTHHLPRHDTDISKLHPQSSLSDPFIPPPSYMSSLHSTTPRLPCLTTDSNLRSTHRG